MFSCINLDENTKRNIPDFFDHYSRTIDSKIVDLYSKTIKELGPTQSMDIFLRDVQDEELLAFAKMIINALENKKVEA